MCRLWILVQTNQLEKEEKKINMSIWGIWMRTIQISLEQCRVRGCQPQHGQQSTHDSGQSSASADPQPRTGSTIQWCKGIVHPVCDNSIMVMF